MRTLLRAERCEQVVEERRETPSSGSSVKQACNRAEQVAEQVAGTRNCGDVEGDLVEVRLKRAPADNTNARIGKNCEPHFRVILEECVHRA